MPTSVATPSRYSTSGPPLELLDAAEEALGAEHEDGDHDAVGHDVLPARRDLPDRPVERLTEHERADERPADVAEAPDDDGGEGEEDGQEAHERIDADLRHRRDRGGARDEPAEPEHPEIGPVD